MSDRFRLKAPTKRKNGGDGAQDPVVLQLDEPVVDEFNEKENGESKKPLQDPRFLDAKVRLHRRLIEEMNLTAVEKIPEKEMRRQVHALVSEYVLQERLPLNTDELGKFAEEVFDEMTGLGPIEPLLKDPTVADVLINTHKQVYVERFGVLEETPVRFKDQNHLLRIVNKIVSAVGRRIDESQPMVDARLADGSRVNAIIPPLAVDGPLVSIRKFSKQPYSLERLVEVDSLRPEIAEVLGAAVRARMSILVSGGTGSGKTTMLNALSDHISKKERLITIEDAAELQLQQPHIGRLETRPPNLEGDGEVRQRELVKNALRMRPDRIIVGEVRGEEAFDMLQAMNTGHEGSMTTIHANSPRDALTRLEQMVGMAGMKMSEESLRSTIASALDIVIQLERMSDGKRRLTSVSEITGIEGHVIQMQEIYAFTRKGVDGEGKIEGEFRATGIRPKFMDVIALSGAQLPANLFNPGQPL
jgi:pilus assembly protein CpaF